MIQLKSSFVNLSDLRKAVSIIYVIVTAINYQQKFQSRTVAGAKEFS